MGSKGEFIGGVLGAAIVGIPGLTAMTALQGFQLGSALGGLFTPNESQSAEYGRLSDVRSSGSTQGAPIPVIFGRHRVGVNIVYLSDITETKRTENVGGGKK
jgi:hypothetical protein